MPRGPKGEKRPADVVGNAVLIGRIATGDVADSKKESTPQAKGASAGGLARAKSLSASKRKEIAKLGGKSRHRND